MSISDHSQKYIGTELELFKEAVNWKRYFSSLIQPFIRGEVLEVGAGIGATTALLQASVNKLSANSLSSVSHWIALEPDATQAGQISQLVNSDALLPSTEVVIGNIESLPTSATFDTILYIDVLEHIENDQAEFANAAARLRKGGRLIVLSPAHNFLFSSFDTQIGHFRRYNQSLFRAINSVDLTEERMLYLDSMGCLLSLANRFILKQQLPSVKQIAFWDSNIVPVSRVLDRIFCYRLGKSIVGIWRK